jgi:Arc/MetJ-type ribon-helix-helix transcriptional regulator
MTRPAMEVNISFRVSRALRDAAQARAAGRGESVSDVLRDALEKYTAPPTRVRRKR